MTAYSPLGSPDSTSIFPRKRPLVLMQDPSVQEVAAAAGRDVGQVRRTTWRSQPGRSDWQAAGAGAPRSLCAASPCRRCCRRRLRRQQAAAPRRCLSAGRYSTEPA